MQHHAEGQGGLGLQHDLRPVDRDPLLGERAELVLNDGAQRHVRPVLVRQQIIGPRQSVKAVEESVRKGGRVLVPRENLHRKAHHHREHVLHAMVQLGDQGALMLLRANQAGHVHEGEHDAVDPPFGRHIGMEPRQIGLAVRGDHVPLP